MKAALKLGFSRREKHPTRASIPVVAPCQQPTCVFAKTSIAVAEYPSCADITTQQYNRTRLSQTRASVTPSGTHSSESFVCFHPSLPLVVALDVNGQIEVYDTAFSTKVHTVHIPGLSTSKNKAGQDGNAATDASTGVTSPHSESGGRFSQAIGGGVARLRSSSANSSASSRNPFDPAGPASSSRVALPSTWEQASRTGRPIAMFFNESINGSIPCPSGTDNAQTLVLVCRNVVIQYDLSLRQLHMRNVKAALPKDVVVTSACALDRSYIVLGCSDGVLRLWHLSTNAVHLALNGGVHSPSPVVQVTLMPAGVYTNDQHAWCLCSADAAGQLVMWNLVVSLDPVCHQGMFVVSLNIWLPCVWC
jgi:WD40 repeat protein